MWHILVVFFFNILPFPCIFFACLCVFFYNFQFCSAFSVFLAVLNSLVYKLISMGKKTCKFCQNYWINLNLKDTDEFTVFSIATKKKSEFSISPLDHWIRSMFENWLENYSLSAYFMFNWYQCLNTICAATPFVMHEITRCAAWLHRVKISN